MLQKVSFSQNYFLSCTAMTIQEAFLHLTETDRFKGMAKKKDSYGGKLRVYRKRFKEGTLKTGAIVELLLANGYEIEANEVIKKESV